MRFAPSPTGSLHIGNARTALFNYLFARKSKGKLILRLEDTDQERSEERFEKELIESLRWLGIQWDEGPDIGGEAGPYRQTKRVALYKMLAEQLILEGKAYPCFCTEKELEARRKEQMSRGRPPGYDGRCRRLSESERSRFMEEGKPYTIRFKVPSNEEVAFEDVIHGPITFSSNALTDFILVRSNGMASYNWAVVVDDAKMGITHVIRGDDHISNTPKQILLYRALGLMPPQYAHHPLILGLDGKRLSKRHGATAVSQFQREGYLPESLVFYLVGLGGIVASDGPLKGMGEIIEAFDLGRVSKAAAIFDHKKLIWINGRFIRELPVETLRKYLDPFLEIWRIKKHFDDGKISAIITCGRDNVQTLLDFEPVFGIFMDTSYTGKEIFEAQERDTARTILEIFADSCKQVAFLDEDGYVQTVKAAMKQSKQRGRTFFMTLRRALTGADHGPELTKIIPILGKDEVINRLTRVLEKL